MEEGGTRELTDVAYGLFEVFLNRELLKRGMDLFDLIENGKDFRSAFEEIFQLFENDYPPVSSLLREEFECPDALYDMFRDGEGVIPSRTKRIYWISQDAPDSPTDAATSEKGGKWLVFVEMDVVDKLWKEIRNATANSQLGLSAKVSTAKPNPDSRDDRCVIYVFTGNWEDEDEVMGIRERLKELGVTWRIGYKRNIETLQGMYSDGGKKVSYYSA